MAGPISGGCDAHWLHGLLTRRHDDPLKVRRRLYVTGRVQGVGFRDFVRRLATGMGVTGFVRNEPDGSVVAEVEGSPEAVEAVMAVIRDDAPRFATVDDVQIDELVPTGEAGFRVTG